ncbi:C-lysozyme inhibitor [Escherichia coli]|nr:C-lysozyme inhibitor [Escherichia coli]EFO1746938.1 C-lysozyme inhibitor [Escherichia coli]
MGRISSGGMMFKAITTVAALVIATSAMAQDDLTISSLAKGETTKAAFNQMVQGHKLPAWVMKGGTYIPAQTVTLGDETYQVMSACKPHDCGSQRIAVMWSEKSNQMTGLFSTIDEKTSQEKLTWLNVNDALSIDGKTVLFAALTGSLENHPDGFNFK